MNLFLLKTFFTSMNSISEALTTWYSANKRDLPWRDTSNAYLIWLSEIILQQTRVEQGLAYYLKFSSEFPTVFDLANADLDDVLKHWQGLGYYSRARNLHATAKQVVEQHDGTFPDSYKELIQLKGIGPYTAAAISSFTSNEDRAVVDGNVFRVLSRLFNIKTPIDTSLGKKEFQQVADSLLPKGKAGIHNQAIMELGALICTPKNPKCNLCPIKEHCISMAAKTNLLLPIKKGKVKVSHRYLYYIIHQFNGTVAVEKRNDSGIWRGLYQFPLIELSQPNDEEKAIELLKTNGVILRISAQIKHVLSHQHLFVKFIHIGYAKKPNNYTNLMWVNELDFDKLAVPRLIDRYLSDLESIFS